MEVHDVEGHRHYQLETASEVETALTAIYGYVTLGGWDRTGNETEPLVDRLVGAAIRLGHEDQATAVPEALSFEEGLLCISALHWSLRRRRSKDSSGRVERFGALLEAMQEHRKAS